MEVLKVSDDTTREELAVAIGSVCDRAKRIPHVVGTDRLPTEWDRRHEQINAMLDQIERAPA